jgi:hypothetical protein
MYNKLITIILERCSHIHIPVLAISGLEFLNLQNITELVKLIGEVLIISVSIYKLFKNKKT